MAISRNERDYKRSRYHQVPFGYTNAIAVLNLLHEYRFAVFKPGFYDRGRGIGKRSRYRLKAESRRFIAGCISILENPDASHFSGKAFTDVVRRTVARFGEALTGVLQQPNILLTRQVADSIRLKNAQDHLIEYDDTDETNGMRANLELWNAFLADNHHVDLLLSDEEFLSVFKESSKDDEEVFLGGEREQSKFIELDRCRLYRVFNNGSFKQGGRFYGGWWQRIPSRYRRAITINGNLTWEFDYSNLHAAMLYARVGIPLGADAYLLPNVSDSFRKLIKTTFFKLINAGKGQRIAPPRSNALPPGVSWEELQKAIIAKHEPIAQFLRSGVGLGLQRIDSDIAQDVMLTLMKEGILVLPVHDSFITYHGHKDTVQRHMARAYKDVMKNEIGIDADPSFVEIWNTEAAMPAKFDAHDVALNEQSRPGFEGYRSRLETFVKSRSDSWRDRFGEPPW